METIHTNRAKQTKNEGIGALILSPQSPAAQSYFWAAVGV